MTDPDVCQVRLDFLAFRMGGPSMVASPFGQCSGDRMAIFAGQNRLGLSEGNLVCGDMTDQHVYIPTDATNGEDNLSLFAMVGTSPYLVAPTLPPAATASPATVLAAVSNYNYTWNIRIEQIDCTAQSDKEGWSGTENLIFFLSLIW